MRQAANALELRTAYMKFKSLLVYRADITVMLSATSRLADRRQLGKRHGTEGNKSSDGQWQGTISSSASKLAKHPCLIDTDGVRFRQYKPSQDLLRCRKRGSSWRSSHDSSHWYQNRVGNTTDTNFNASPETQRTQTSLPLQKHTGRKLHRLYRNTTGHKLYCLSNLRQNESPSEQKNPSAHPIRYCQSQHQADSIPTGIPWSQSCRISDHTLPIKNTSHWLPIIIVWKSTS